ncbi:phosphate transporter permease subunit PstC [Escherichia coli]|uniref:Phosphate transporter permease subunit PstC n=1 Tax=Escherichia coli TaxID=562 RepID=A0A377B4D5_ECOLX|nr:phosphate transporter permease subunit PstC [Escherichia coli]
MSNIPIVGAAVLWPCIWYRYLAAGVILAIMIIPYIAAVMRDVFGTNPGDDERVGLRYWLHHLGSYLAYRSSVHPKMVLSAASCWGWAARSVKTMAVTFIIGNTYQLDSASLYMRANSITSALANEFAEAESGLHVAALMELGLILFVITFIVLAASKFMIMRLAKNEGAR